jgi:CheY-like chemotaxis protein
MDALGQLTGGIAHDFNNLLQAVQGSLALIARRPEDVGRVRLLAEEGMQVAQRGASLTGQLLAFSRTGQLDLRPVGVRPMLEGLRDLLRRSLGPMVVVEMDLPEEAVAARADRTQLEMAVLNLVINARDAMPEGGRVALSARTVTVEADPELSPGAYVLLEVEDDGSGMAPEVLRRAMEPFFTTKGVGKGTGLGLSQVYGMARQAGGTARIESAPGEGTTVRLWLPRAAGEAETAAPEGSPALRARRGATVLVVDDDPDVRRWLVAAVRSLGHRVLEAADGASGLAALEEDPDLALLDFAMPGMNGAELAQAIRERRPDLPVLMATGYADPAALPAGLRVLRKPFALSDLEAALSEALRSPEGAAAAS